MSLLQESGASRRSLQSGEWGYFSAPSSGVSTLEGPSLRSGLFKVETRLKHG
ncbi:MAG: hypothetical protein ABR545_03965 [Cyclonatronaceae bacterium]